MRAAFVRALVDLAARDPRVLLLTGDLGFMALEPFVERFPSRFVNVGVAEQNLVGLSAGLADAGFIPFVYSIAPFVTLRPYEHLRNLVLAHRLPVRLVGMGGGFDYGKQGLTHWALEDVAVLRVQPGIMVFVPADPVQVAAAVAATETVPGPLYLRLSRDDFENRALGLSGRFDPASIEVVRDGKDGLVLALGNAAGDALAAAEQVAADGLRIAVGVVSCPHPAPSAALDALLRRFPFVVTVEAHYAAGGLGSLVAEHVAEEGLRCRLARCAVRTMPTGVSGSREYLTERYGLSRAAIVAEVRRLRDTVARGSEA